MDNPRALILGCSHAAGSEMHNSISTRDDRYGITRSYPVLIAQALGYQAENLSIPGGSNDAMFRLWQENLHNLMPGHDIVIACWTGRHRTEIWHDKHKTWLPISIGVESWKKRFPDDLRLPGQYIAWPNQGAHLEYSKQWSVFQTDPESGKLNKLKNIIALNSTAEYLGIKVINIHSFDSIVVDRYLWPVKELEFCDWCRNHDFDHTESGHFYDQAHAEFAEYALKGLS